ncbi:MAG: type II toxin-antitoxin system Phd/YefM family antitoxin [Clostridiales Family XIII bacterium]|nr:type II toxin-antitoxin system Phd/YefM family antitoxin [Clostridiales Family XIII bacterium]
MPQIRPSADLRNRYNEISEYCHENEEPIFITKNGRGDLAVMSVEAYEKLTARMKLYSLLEEGLEDFRAGRYMPFEEAMDQIEKDVFGGIQD